ncbi:hypothetical protein EV359DRAFT_1809, partial [Lentinula novae-zelandiae]
RSQSERKMFSVFIKRVLEHTQVSMIMILVAVVYLQRAKSVIQIQTKLWVEERILLGALILSSKFIDKHGIVNHCWSMCTIFNCEDVYDIQAQFLTVLNWNLKFTELDI